MIIVKRQTSKVRPGDHREDDRSCAWPIFSLARIFPRALYSDLKGGGDYMTGHVEKCIRGDKALILLSLLLVGTPSALGPQLAYSLGRA